MLIDLFSTSACYWVRDAAMISRLLYQMLLAAVLVKTETSGKGSSAFYAAARPVVLVLTRMNMKHQHRMNCTSVERHMTSS